MDNIILIVGTVLFTCVFAVSFLYIGWWMGSKADKVSILPATRDPEPRSEEADPFREEYLDYE